MTWSDEEWEELQMMQAQQNNSTPESTPRIEISHETVDRRFGSSVNKAMEREKKLQASLKLRKEDEWKLKQDEEAWEYRKKRPMSENPWVIALLLVGLFLFGWYAL